MPRGSSPSPGPKKKQSPRPKNFSPGPKKNSSPAPDRPVGEVVIMPLGPPLRFTFSFALFVLVLVIWVSHFLGCLTAIGTAQADENRFRIVVVTAFQSGSAAIWFLTIRYAVRSFFLPEVGMLSLFTKQIENPVDLHLATIVAIFSVAFIFVSWMFSSLYLARGLLLSLSLICVLTLCWGVIHDLLKAAWIASDDAERDSTQWRRRTGLTLFATAALPLPCSIPLFFSIFINSELGAPLKLSFNALISVGISLFFSGAPLQALVAGGVATVIEWQLSEGNHAVALVVVFGLRFCAIIYALLAVSHASMAFVLLTIIVRLFVSAVLLCACLFAVEFWRTPTHESGAWQTQIPWHSVQGSTSTRALKLLRQPSMFITLVVALTLGVYPGWHWPTILVFFAGVAIYTIWLTCTYKSALTWLFLAVILFTCVVVPYWPTSPQGYRLPSSVTVGNTDNFLCKIPLAANVHVWHLATLANISYDERNFSQLQQWVAAEAANSEVLPRSIDLVEELDAIGKIYKVGQTAIVVFRGTHLITDWFINGRLWLGSMAAEMIASANPLGVMVEFLLNTPDWATLNAVAVAQPSSQTGSVVSEYLKCFGWKHLAQNTLRIETWLNDKTRLVRELFVPGHVVETKHHLCSIDHPHAEILWKRLKAHQLIDDKIIFVGHSLGGGIAQYFASLQPSSFGKFEDEVAARSKYIEAVTFNAPGASRSYYAWNIEKTNEIGRQLHVRLDNDVVSRIDSADGLVQVLPCHSESPITCHKMEAVISALWRHCNISVATVSHSRVPPKRFWLMPEPSYFWIIFFVALAALSALVVTNLL